MKKQNTVLKPSLNFFYPKGKDLVYYLVILTQRVRNKSQGQGQGQGRGQKVKVKMINMNFIFMSSITVQSIFS